ncbi:acyl-CoA synthetase (AMP-forming)/AMP-acid ligase II [Oikeobacillus pervagus]|uniref:Acyl-CoA synthetase (AMP-forming)/AMP-acid ligase II n=1 Tax=Oikeobacillus pervagus TaxID=1325931 RepID=A0AAJ1SY55_9BACI|nr:long-chain-fatty-acid--CoA ligase [Oikeobacillus pervagus]MDQ0214930.1 acyl-CoA synthetase (AMP-forming)/AMP-acid ligase II [Oikeobacillus pervagus]
MINIQNEKKYELIVPQLLENAYRTAPNREVIYDGERRLTYHDLMEESTSIAYSLQQMGVKKGDRIAVCLPNSHEFIVLLFAISKIGAILIPFNTRYRIDEIEYILRNSGAKIAFFTKEFENIHHFDQFVEINKKLSSLERLVTVRFQEEICDSYDQLLKQGKNRQPSIPPIDPKEDVFAILYTSGTTGKPKGVMLTHQNVLYTGTVAKEKMQCTEDDVFLIPVPVFHIFGIVFIMHTVCSQARMVLMEKFSAHDALTLIQNEKVTVHAGVPSMFILELNHPSFYSFDLSSLRTGEMAAAPCPVEIVRKIKVDMGCNVLVAYGLTETSANLTITDFTDDDNLKSETVGKAIEGTELKIVDKNRKEVSRGEVGELACRSLGLMKSYYNMPEQTKEVVDEAGWFYTGDLATMDEEGYIRIVGRTKEMIIRGGYNIYPREIEDVFYEHPSVLDIAVVGLPDTVLGEIVCAAIRLKQGEEFDEIELKEFAKQKLADYKVPDKIILTDDFPMTASGKILKTSLQKRLKQDLQAELR